MKNSVKTTLCLLAVSALIAPVGAHALAIKGETRVQNKQRTLNTARELGLASTDMEKQVIDYLTEMKKKNPDQFQSVLNEKLNNSSEYQSWAYAVRDNADTVTKAKSIAKIELFNSIKGNWSKVQTTTVNKSATDDWNTFRADLIEQLNELEYRQKDDDGNYLFALSDWAIIQVSQDHKRVTWNVNLHSRYDGNRLQDGVEEITIKEDKSR